MTRPDISKDFQPGYFQRDYLTIGGCKDTTTFRIGAFIWETLDPLHYIPWMWME